MTAPAPIQIRARLTPAEYRRLRVIAALRAVEISTLVADALRATYNLEGDNPK